jgi:hypothetical protein
MSASTPSAKGTALVTGASSGIGARYAERLARRGHDLLLVARDIGRLDALAAELRATAGVRVETLRADLTDTTDLRTVEARVRTDPAIAMIVNNAGLGPTGAVLDSDPDYLDRMIALNVVALNRLSVAAAATFAARGAGTIVNVGSVVAFFPEQFSGTYSATKAFVLSLTQSLAAETAGRGVRVQAVLPGVTRTEIFERTGTSVDAFPPEMVMDAGELVDAALAGLDQGELVTIPSLPDAGEHEELVKTRLALVPNLSLRHAASRYAVPRAA